MRLSTFGSFIRATALVLTAASGCSVLAADTPVNVVGAGSTFVYPAIAKWAELYKAHTGNSVNYQSIGSGAGVRQIKAKTVDFGATDKPLKIEELDKAGLTQFPIIIGGVVPVVNIEGIKTGDLKLTGAVLADIFLGKIKKWNEKPIVDLNPGVKLPDASIAVVHRADGSGTTFLFTDYLSKVSPEWKTSVGSDASVSWKTGIGGKGNEGVTAYVQRIKGSIGYIEYAYAKRNNLASVKLKNAAGTFVQPDDTAFSAAAANAKWNQANGFYEVLTDEPGQNSWPITGATFVLIHKQAADAKKGQTVVNFFNWALKHGQKEAAALEFVPLPTAVVTQVEESWKKNVSGITVGAQK